jgi:putative tryptophan/tyrosine transport system substrate-binding protein
MKRRQFITLIGSAALASPRPAIGQSLASQYTIGVLWPATSPPAPPRMESFRQALRQLDFVEGRNVVIELRHPRAGPQELPDLAAELVRLKVDVIAAFGDHAPRVVQQATQTIPIVAISDDMFGAGIITSLSRPGGNTTGLTILAPELSAKRLEVLQEMVPGMSRVAAFWDPTTGASQLATTENAARALKLKVQVLEIRRQEELLGAFQAAREGQAQAINVFGSPFLASLYREIVILAAEYRLPAIYQWREHVEAGGLISYGPNLAAMWRQSAAIVVKILKGAAPADLPVEQPTKFELVLNAKTAKSLGLAIPPSMLVRADEVIE